MFSTKCLIFIYRFYFIVMTNILKNYNSILNKLIVSIIIHNFCLDAHYNLLYKVCLIFFHVHFLNFSSKCVFYHIYILYMFVLLWFLVLSIL